MEENKRFRELAHPQWAPAPEPAARQAPAPWSPRGLPSMLIMGRREDGQVFRPSDWAERLAGVAQIFGAQSRGRMLAMIRVEQDEQCQVAVRVSESLKALELSAWDFMSSFARENALAVRFEPWPDYEEPTHCAPRWTP